MLALVLLAVTLRAPVLTWNACPFECCTYGQWTALRDIHVFTNRSEKAPRKFTLHRGDKVTTSGVVITKRLGIMRATQKITLGDGPIRTTVPAGERFYVLHYLGEGQYSFWYEGKRYTDGGYLSPTRHDPRVVPASGAELIQVPVWEWWVRVKTARGATGWVLGNRGFDGSDRCS